MEVRNSVAGADPDIAIGFRQNAVSIAILPDQSFLTSVVAPCSLVKSIDAPVCSDPHITCAVAADKVALVGAEAVALRIVCNRRLRSGSKFQPAHSQWFRVTDPNGPIGSFSNSEDRIHLQPIRLTEPSPLAIFQ